MTASAVDSRIESAAFDQTRGWMVSMALHLAVGAGAFFFMVEIDQPVLRDSFQWEISMMDSPAPTESKPAEPVTQSPLSPVKPNPPIRQTTQSVGNQPLPEVHREATHPVETAHMVKDVVTNPEPVMEYATVAPTESEPVTSATVVETPVESIVPQAEHRLVEYRQVLHRDTRADYGWLRDALWGRIEELKRYPVLARTNHWEGKVVVSAVIRDDGEVTGVQIAETSGRAVLDEEAMAVMKKASPLRLKHPLGQRQVTILIPISYRLDG